MGGVWSWIKRPPPPPPRPSALQLMSKLLSAPAPGGGALAERLAKLFGSFLPIVLVLLPSFYMLYSGNQEGLSSYFSPNSMYVGAGNSFAWLLYNTVLMRDKPSIEEVLANGLVLMSNCQNLINLCTLKNLKQRGYAIGISLCAGMFLVLCLVIWTPNLPTWVKLCIGILGILTSMGTHISQLYDIVISCPDKWTRFFIAMNLVPNMSLNLAYFVITKGWNDQDIITQAVSAIGIVLNFLEIVALGIYGSTDMEIKKQEKPASESDKKNPVLPVVTRDVKRTDLERQCSTGGPEGPGAFTSCGVPDATQANFAPRRPHTTQARFAPRRSDSAMKRPKNETLRGSQSVVETVKTDSLLCAPGRWCGKPVKPNQS